MFELRQSNRPYGPKNSVDTINCEISIAAYTEYAGIGMGRLTDGSAYLSQRGLAILCGVENAHIGTIGRDWSTVKPRIVAIKARLDLSYSSPYRVLTWAGRRQYAYDMAVCEAILDYYALDAGHHIQPEAQANRIKFGCQSLSDFVIGALAPKAAPRQPLRFKPMRRSSPESYETFDAVITCVCGLFALSAWLANSYIEGLKQRALSTSWSRLGLYLPLKAILEMQVEAILQSSQVWQMPAAAPAASLVASGRV